MKASSYDFSYYYDYVGNAVTFAMFKSEYYIFFMGTLKKIPWMSVPYAANKAFINVQRTDTIDFTV